MPCPWVYIEYKTYFKQSYISSKWKVCMMNILFSQNCSEECPSGTILWLFTPFSILHSASSVPEFSYYGLDTGSTCIFQGHHIVIWKVSKKILVRFTAHNAYWETNVRAKMSYYTSEMIKFHVALQYKYWAFF